MNRRNFLKILSQSAASVALAPSVAQALCPPARLQVDGIGNPAAAAETCVPGIKTAIDWSPGHYIATQGGSSSVGIADIDEIADYVNNRPYLRGIVIRPMWPSLEGATLGSYNYTLIDHALNALADDKRLYLQYQMSKFNSPAGTSSDLAKVVPAYMLSSKYYGGAYASARGGGGFDLDPKIWKTPVMDRLTAMISNHGNRYGKNPKFAGIVISELTWGLTDGEADFSAQEWKDCLLNRYLPRSRAAFPTKNIIVYMSYIQGGSGFSQTEKFTMTRDKCRELFCHIGGPDVLPCEGGSLGLKVARGEDTVTNPPIKLNASSSVTANKIGIHCSLQYPDLMGTGTAQQCSATTTQEYLNWMHNTQHANVIFWTYYPTAKHFSAAMNLISAKPNAYHNAIYPSEFPKG